MEVNIPKLKGVMAEKGISARALAAKSGISKSTLCRKLSKGGKGLKVGEMHDIVTALELDGETARNIFLFQNSQKREF